MNLCVCDLFTTDYVFGMCYGNSNGISEWISSWCRVVEHIYNKKFLEDSIVCELMTVG